jgi:hypothetical protein
MSAGVEDIRRDIDHTRVELDRKIGLIEGKVHAAKTAVSDAFDIRHQVSRRPWTMVGVSVATGFALGRLTVGPRRPSAPSTMTASEPVAAPSARGFWHHDLVNTLTLAAGAALTDVARDFLHASFPSVAKHADRLWSERG